MEAAWHRSGVEGKYGEVKNSEPKEKRMKRLSNPLRMLFVLLAVVLLTACAPEAQQQPPSAEEIQ